ncbi:MAG: HAD hydrolase-like protein [Clostridia bacterium]|nr:HAD hydrolase-like protein [Clostridia bacterium]
MIKTILFDLEGTMIHSSETQIPVLKKLFEYFNVDITNINFRTLIGPPLICTFENYFGKENSKLAVEKYIEIFNNLEIENISHIKGIENCLSYLKNKGYTLNTVSLQMQEICERELKILDLYKYFDNVYGDNPEKPHYSKGEIIKETADKFEKETAVMVGDTKFDVQAGLSCGLNAIWVNWGYGLEQDIPENISKAKSFENLIEIIESL